MADNQITVGIDLEDDLTPKLNEIKKGLDGLQSTQPGGGWKIGDIGQGAHEAGEGVGFLAEQFKELGSGIGYTIGAWNLGFMIAEKAIEAVADAFKNASDMQGNFVEQMNITRTSTTQQRMAFEELKSDAKASGETVDEFTKFIMPTVKALEMLGISEHDAGKEAEVLSQYFKAFGVDMRDLATKTELNVASFGDLLKAGNALGPMFQQEVLAWEKWSIAEQQAMPGLQRSRQLMNDTAQDAQRAASAHEGFAQSTGIAGVAFQAFQQRVGTQAGPVTRFDIPQQLANLAPGAYWDFNRLAAQQQKRFQEGVEQIAKEENLPARTVQLGVRAGLPGFGQQELLAAAGRRREEGEITRHRGEQADDFERQSAALQEQIKLNKEATGIIKEQAGYEEQITDRLQAFGKYQESIKGTTDKLAAGWSNIGTSVGDAANALKESDKTLSDMSKKLHEVPFTPAAGQGWGPAAQPPAPIHPGQPGQPATELTLAIAVSKLDEVTRLLGIVFQ